MIAAKMESKEVYTINSSDSEDLIEEITPIVIKREVDLFQTQEMTALDSQSQGFSQIERPSLVKSRSALIKAIITEHEAKGTSHLQVQEASARQWVKWLEQERVLSETWIYVELDSFCASVEIKHNPRLADMPMIVADNYRVLSANQLAQKLGINDKQTPSEARQKCPAAVTVKPRRSIYLLEATKVKAILKEYDANVENPQLGQFSLRVTSVLKARGIKNEAGKLSIADEVKTRIFISTQLTCSVGVACNQFLAKICSQERQPNDIYCLAASKPQIKEFMSDKPVSVIPGVSEEFKDLLSELQVYKCCDILSNRLYLYLALPSPTYQALIRGALGIHADKSVETQVQKHLMASKSFPPTSENTEVEKRLNELTEELELQLQKYRVTSKEVTVTLKTLKYAARSKYL